MKRHIKFALVYAVLAMACGVFYREFTKAYAFTGDTALGKVHTHLFLLGMVVFLLFALFDAKLDLRHSKLYLPFMIVYNAGVGVMSVMLIVRGVFDVRAACPQARTAPFRASRGWGTSSSARASSSFLSCCCFRCAKASRARTRRNPPHARRAKQKTKRANRLFMPIGTGRGAQPPPCFLLPDTPDEKHKANKACDAYSNNYMRVSKSHFE